MNKRKLLSVTKYIAVGLVSLFRLFLPGPTVNGISYSRPRSYQLFFRVNNKISEKWMLELVSAVMDRNGAFIDVGANVGQTLLSVKSVDPAIRYIGFEPNPVSYYYMLKLIEKNRFEQVSLIPIGLSSANKIEQYWVSRYFPASSGATMNSSVKEIEGKVARFTPVFCLDYLIAELNAAPSIIKIDVEGYEAEVLGGAIEVIKRHEPLLILEFLPPRSPDDVGRRALKEKLDNICARINYEVYRIICRGSKNLKGLKKIESFPDNPDSSLGDEDRDYLLVPKREEKQRRILMQVPIIE